MLSSLRVDIPGLSPGPHALDCLPWNFVSSSLVLETHCAVQYLPASELRPDPA